MRNFKTRTQATLGYLGFSCSHGTQGSCGRLRPALPPTTRAAPASSLPPVLSLCPFPHTQNLHLHGSSARTLQEVPLAASFVLLRQALSLLSCRNRESELLMGHKSLNIENRSLKPAEVGNTDLEVIIMQQRFKTMELT